MGDKRKILLLVLLLLGLAACGGGDEEPPPATAGGDEIDVSVQQTMNAVAVAQTVAALTTGQATAAPEATATEAVVTATTPAEAPPTSTAEPPTSPPPTPPEATAAPAAAACEVVSDVNLRPGPGTVYDPPIVAMRVGAQLAPLAYSPTGFPQGPWLFGQLTLTGQTGWVSARPQYITCNVDYNDLPLATNLPPTPTPAAVAQTPPNIDNDAPGGSFPEDGTVTFNIIADPNFLFRMDVRDLTVGGFEGAGIRSVGFAVSGNGVDYFREERTAGFCIFGGGEPTCNPWPVNEAGEYTWGEGGPVVESGEYFINMAVEAEREDEEFFGFWNWNFNFRVTIP